MFFNLKPQTRYGSSCEKFRLGGWNQAESDVKKSLKAASVSRSVERLETVDGTHKQRAIGLSKSHLSTLSFRVLC